MHRKCADTVGLQDFGVCIPSTYNSTNSYIEYECINSTVVVGMYSDASCTDPLEGIASAEVTNGMCTRNTTTSCSTTGERKGRYKGGIYESGCMQSSA